MADLQAKMIEPVFKMTYRIIYGDTDSGGLVYNANFLRFMEMGRTEMLRNWAIPYSEMEDQGIILPVTESYLRYKASGRYDDLITIATALAEVKPFFCRFHYRITRPHETGAEDLLLVKGFTKHACTDRQGKLMSFPERVQDKIMQIWQR
ncbi:MAG: acyl-CoA thioesterase [Candidatus Electrothrix sp. AR3]|nr:acyl-CoA thioesterase [Candidatus Electrothrix sp. AR3]